MKGNPFLDTNILVYAFASNDWRGPKAEAIVGSGGIISVQVLNEFVNTCHHKLKREWREIERALAIIADLLDPPIPLTREVHQAAIGICRHHKLSFYDSLIVAAAASSDCRLLYSEDMQHGQKIGLVTVQNPFR
jgi:predicted nucleic acid-binding protein